MTEANVDIMPLAEFEREFKFLNPGQRVEYFRGFLMLTRNRKTELGRALCALGNRAWMEYRAGRCTLVQRRHGPEDYSYYAERI